MDAGFPESGNSHGLIYDWNEVGRSAHAPNLAASLLDETLRDGLQNPSVIDPSVGQKIELLHLMGAVGIRAVDLGMPAAAGRVLSDAIALAKEIAVAKLPLSPGCAARTLVSDIAPIVEVAERSGNPVEAFIFTGSSSIRQLAESWDLDLLLRRSADSIDAAVRAGLPVCYVTEDTTRSRPEILRSLLENAIGHGASRICVSDTVGHATPNGVRSILRFVQGVVAGAHSRIAIDWHGHNDRGLALQNALVALDSGADRAHGTALGIGERVGNAPIELLLLNLKLEGALETQDLTQLLAYCSASARALGWQIPVNHPLVGADAFRTATGVHAAAIMKAQAKGDQWLADRIYSAVPASAFGRRQEICIGFMSGASNVTYWLRQRGIEPTPALIDKILSKAKTADHLLSDAEVLMAIGRAPDSAQ